MLRSLKEFEHCKVSAADGDIGSIQDFLLDDERWSVRYLMVETSGFLDRQQVLISPISFRQADWSGTQFHLALTKEEVRMSPSIDTNRPVSRQQEIDLSGYYGYPNYWNNSGLWGMSDYPGSLAAERWRELSVQNAENLAGIHVRCASEIRGYQVQGSDAPIGDIENFIIDDQTWEVRFLVIDASSWWGGERVLVAPRWATRIGWDERQVYVDLPRQLVKNCPKWSSTLEINREYEVRLHDYYGRTLQGDHGDRLVDAPTPRQSTSHPG
jgi:hypothetical protein